MITEGKLTGIWQRDSPPWLWMTMGRVVLEKFDRIMWHFDWTLRLAKFSKKSWWAFLSHYLMWRGVESEDDPPKQRGFQDGVDLRLDAMHRLSERERERERQAKKQQSTVIPKEWKEGTYAWIINDHVTCNKKKHHGLSPIQTYQHTTLQQSKHTSKMHETLL